MAYKRILIIILVLVVAILLFGFVVNALPVKCPPVPELPPGYPQATISCYRVWEWEFWSEPWKK
jgi:hypothetical protein